MFEMIGDRQFNEFITIARVRRQRTRGIL